MGRSLQSGCCMAPTFLRPDLFFYMSNVLCDLFDVGFYFFVFAALSQFMVPDLLVFAAFCLWLSPVLQGALLLGALAPIYLLVTSYEQLWPRKPYQRRRRRRRHKSKSCYQWIHRQKLHVIVLHMPMVSKLQLHAQWCYTVGGGGGET